MDESEFNTFFAAGAQNWLKSARTGSAEIFITAAMSSQGVENWVTWCSRPHCSRPGEIKVGLLSENYPEADLYTRAMCVITDPDLVQCEACLIYMGSRIETKDGTITSWLAYDANEESNLQVLKNILEGPDSYDFLALLSKEGTEAKRADAIEGGINFPPHFKDNIRAFLEAGKKYKSVKEQGKNLDSVIEDVVLDMGKDLMDALIGPASKE